jgi:hypothetical protein
MCQFRIKHIFALQSFSEFALGKSNLVSQDVRIGIVQSDRDGPVRTSVSIALARYLQTRGITTSMCRFKNICTPETIDHENNICGAPHSVFSRVENMVKRPYEMYWERSLFNSVQDYILDKHKSHLGNFSGDIDISQCVESYEPLTDMHIFNDIGTKYVSKALEIYQQ